jgi:hypothetical protein
MLIEWNSSQGLFNPNSIGEYSEGGFFSAELD